MNPILAKAVETLSVVVNISTGLAHPLDESRAKELFKALHSHGVPLSYEDIYSLAIANAWPERHAKSLAELAKKNWQWWSGTNQVPQTMGRANSEEDHRQSLESRAAVYAK